MLINVDHARAWFKTELEPPVLQTLDVTFRQISGPAGPLKDPPGQAI